MLSATQTCQSKLRPATAARAPANATPTDLLMWGSITKMYTASSISCSLSKARSTSTILRGCTSTASYSSLNGTTLADLFGAESAARVTVRHLLSMRSGLYDFDDDETRAFCNAHPNRTVSPLDDLAFASTRGARTPLYPAGSHRLSRRLSCSASSSPRRRTPRAGTRRISSATPSSGRPSCAAASRAPCAARPVLFYADVPATSPTTRTASGLDTAFMSCTNGWTCGNIAAPAAEVADFVWALYGTASIVSRASVDAMTKIWDGDGGWYGLGTMGLPGYVGGKRYCRVGHCGVTYGYTAVASYNRVLNYSLVWGMGQEDPGQTRTHGAYYDYLLSFDCEVTAALLGVLEGGGRRRT